MTTLVKLRTQIHRLQLLSRVNRDQGRSIQRAFIRIPRVADAVLSSHAAIMGSAGTDESAQLLVLQQQLEAQ